MIKNLDTLPCFKKCFIWILILIACFFLYMVRSFCMPFMVSALVVFVTYPIYIKVLRIIKVPYLASFITLILIFILLVIPLSFTIYWSYDQAFSLFLNTENQWKELSSFIDLFMAKVTPALNYLNAEWIYSDGSFNIQDITEYVYSKFQIIFKKVFSSGLFLSKNILSTLFEIAISIFFVFYFYVDGKIIIKKILILIPIEYDKKQQLVKNLIDTLYSSVKCIGVIGIIQGFLGGVVLWICDFQAPIFWSFVMFLLAVIPAVGVFVILLPASLVLFFQGFTVLAIFLLISCFFIGGIDYILRPLIMREKTQMHDLLIIVSTLGGIQLFGIVGVLLGPMIASLLMSLLKFYQEIFKQDFHFDKK